MVSFQGGLIQITGNPALICLLDTNSKGPQMFPFILSPHLSPHKPSRIPLQGFSPFFPFLLYLLPEINSRLFLVVYRYIVINFGTCSGKKKTHKNMEYNRETQCNWGFKDAIYEEVMFKSWSKGWVGQLKTGRKNLPGTRDNRYESP